MVKELPRNIHPVLCDGDDDVEDARCLGAAPCYDAAAGQSCMDDSEARATAYCDALAVGHNVSAARGGPGDGILGYWSVRGYRFRDVRQRDVGGGQCAAVLGDVPGGPARAGGGGEGGDGRPRWGAASSSPW